MLTFKKVNNQNELPTNLSIDDIIKFLHTYLDDFRDNEIAIGKAISYAFSTVEGKGGFLLLAFYEKELAGVLVMNKTGMEEFIPENILVYIAVKKEMRGKGFGRAIIEEASKHAEGAIALHVEYDNPARHLYERLGFVTKYAEMRWNPKK